MTAPSRPGPGWTLRGRLSRNVLATLAAGWLATMAVGFAVLDHEMSEVLDEGMQTDARLLLAMLDQQNGVGVVPQWLQLAPGGEEQLLRVLVPGKPVPPAPWPSLSKEGFHDAGDWRVLRRSSPLFAVEIGQSRAFRHEELLESARAFLFMLLPLLGGLLWVILRTTGQAMAPADAFAHAVAARETGDMTAFPEADLPQELWPMAQALNDYLRRIAALRDAEARFIANAAHELRTPLATARAQLRLMEGRPDVAEGVGRLVVTVETMTRHVERLLQLSRAEAGIGISEGEADLIRILWLVIDDLRPATPGGILFDDGNHEDFVLRIDPDALAILLRNIIGNAVEHGTGAVRVVLRPDAVLEVSNPVAADAAFYPNRFEKGPASRGTGLGFAIIISLSEQLSLPLDYQIEGGVARVRLGLAGRRRPVEMPVEI